MSSIAYRNDIDGVRAFSVISVILFHLGFLRNGYLGVDVFFVISGFLITGIVYNEVFTNKYSILKFYERRLRRIFPLVLFASLVSLIVGYFVMLPDDFENLCQSVIASNFSANNILMYITSNDYWAIKNDFKPLMHTWSLGVEEQFYIIFPLLIFTMSGRLKNLILPILIVLTLLSLTLFIGNNNDDGSKFYFIQYRFFEMSFGGVLAILNYQNSKFLKILKPQFTFVLFLMLLSLLLFGYGLENMVLILSVTIISGFLLLSGGLFEKNQGLYNYFLTNKLVTFIGKISFSLYMWHQIIFAFSRYFVFEEISIPVSFLLLLLTLGLSILSYYIIENPFRDRNVMPIGKLLLTVSILFIFINFISLYYYLKGGVVRDVPELDVSVSNTLNDFSTNINTNIQYNESARQFKKEFSKDTNTAKVIVLGDSFGRDLINLLNESSFKDKIELNYLDIWVDKVDSAVIKKIKESQIVFLASKAEITKRDFGILINLYKLDSSKVYYFGVKDFGVSNGIFYHKIRSGAYCQDLKTNVKSGVVELNNKLKSDWPNQYIDIISLLINEQGQVPVFTDDGKFISQDTEHLTKPGAIFMAKKFESKLSEVIF